MNAKQMTAAFGLAATMLLGAGTQSFAAETPMTQEEKNNIQQSLFKAYADELEKVLITPDDAREIVSKIHQIALVNSKVAVDATPVLTKFKERTTYRSNSDFFTSVRMKIDNVIKQINDRWDVMAADASCKSNEEIAPAVSSGMPGAPHGIL